MDVVGEDAIGLAQHAGIVLQAREERAGLAARIPSQREAGGEGPGPFLQALDAEELGAERLLGFQAAAAPEEAKQRPQGGSQGDRKSTRLNSSHVRISYAVFCLKKKNTTH